MSLLPLVGRGIAWIKSGFSILPKALFWSVVGTVGTLSLSPEVKAAESITLRYGAEVRTFEVSNIAAFTQSGQAEDPELQSFFQRAPEARRLLQEILSAEIYISPSFVARIEEGLQSPTGDFVLIQLNKLVSTPSPSEDLEPLRTALVEAFEDDNRFSLLEVIRQYPAPEIELDLTGLEPVYNDVKGFVERVLPALEVAREYLQDVICDCETTTATQAANPTANPTANPAGVVPISAEQRAKCFDQAKTAGQAPAVEQGLALPTTPSTPTQR